MDDGNNILRGNALNPEAHTVFLTWRSLRLFSLLFEGFSYFIVGKLGRDVPSDEIIVLRALSLTLSRITALRNIYKLSLPLVHFKLDQY